MYQVKGRPWIRLINSIASFGEVELATGSFKTQWNFFALNSEKSQMPTIFPEQSPTSEFNFHIYI